MLHFLNIYFISVECKTMKKRQGKYTARITTIIAKIKNNVYYNVNT